MLMIFVVISSDLMVFIVSVFGKHFKKMTINVVSEMNQRQK